MEKINESKVSVCKEKGESYFLETLSLKQQEDKLFSEWEKEECLKGYYGINQDGLADESSYLQSLPKIAFILKEAYGKENFDMRPYYYDGAHAGSKTWRTAPLWIAGISKIYEENKSTIAQIKTEKRNMGWKEFNQEYIRKIAILNLNKQCTTNGKLTDRKYFQSGIDNKKFINKQIEIYNPEIIICGGTFYPFYDRIYDYKNFDTKYESANQNKQYAEGYKDKKGRLIINTFHPGAIKKEEPWYDSIMEIVERFKSEGLFAK